MNNSILQLQQQRMLLQIEYNHEKEEFRRQTETMGVERKVRRGDAWFPVQIGRNYYNSLNQMVVEVERKPGSDIEHNFEPGRPVCFFTMRRDPKTGKLIPPPGRERIEVRTWEALGDGILEYVGPLVEPGLQEKPLSIAMREIHEDLLEHTEGE